MIKGLYDSFAARWYRGGSVWFYSDPHFADNEMQDLRHNYISDEEQVKRINSKLGKNDTIIFLGDIGDVSLIKKIKGYKVLVMGNHDAGSTNYIDAFDEVYEGILTIGPKIVLSHEPVNIPYAFNIHGHVHSMEVKDDDMHLNVCAEHIDYTPVCLSKLIKQGLFTDVKNIHRDTIDKARNKKKKKVNKEVGQWVIGYMYQDLFY